MTSTWIKASLQTLVVTGLLFILTTAVRAEIVYQWVPDAGSGGNGFIRFDETFIAAADDGTKHYVYTDDANFITQFGNPPVLEFAFTFDSGLVIDDVVNFSSASTIQTEHTGTQFQALGGVMDGWTFEYVHYDNVILPNSYSGTTTAGILCFTLPCPQPGGDVVFNGIGDAEFHSGSFQLVVPEPSALFLGATAILGGIFFRRRR